MMVFGKTMLRINYVMCSVEVTGLTSPVDLRCCHLKRLMMRPQHSEHEGSEIHY